MKLNYNITLLNLKHTLISIILKIEKRYLLKTIAFWKEMTSSPEKVIGSQVDWLFNNVGYLRKNINQLRVKIINSLTNHNKITRVLDYCFIGFNY